MKKLKFIIAFLLILSSTLICQEIGEIFIWEEAEKMFGNVLEEQSITTEALKNVLKNTINSVMFNVNNSELTILGDNRKALYFTDSYSENNEIFHLFSKSKLEELLNLGNKEICLFQKREKAYTIQNGQFILEYSIPCPPICN
ncbi:MAG: hypothetical protein IPH62_17545 [Ignavibacteriae bacterium]|nr:hypothetical protein [Ignavibacteriota bacterium]